MRLARQERAGGEAPLGTANGTLDDRGFIMVALLIGIAVTAVWMAALLPSWRQQALREKEADLIFRGEQYARAVALYRRKTGALPPSIDVLVSQHYLRKKYVDPITGKDFLPVGGAATVPVAGQATQVGVSGVRSTSNETSIKVYLNQQTYSQFPFDWTNAATRMGVPTTDQSGRGGAPGPARGGGVVGPARGAPGPGRLGPAQGGAGSPRGAGGPNPDQGRGIQGGGQNPGSGGNAPPGGRGR